jgi:hypothetical protein
MAPRSPFHRKKSFTFQVVRSIFCFEYFSCAQAQRDGCRAAVRGALEMGELGVALSDKTSEVYA